MKLIQNIKIVVLLLFPLMFLGGNPLFSQNKKAEKTCQKAMELINKQEYAKAEKELRKVFAMDSTYAKAYLLQGDIYSLQLNAEKASDYYVKAIALSKKPRPALYFIAAEEELKCERYESAKSHYMTYLANVNSDDPMLKSVQKGLQTCDFGIKSKNNPLKFEPVNLGPNINSEWDEYLPTLTADESELVLTVRRPRDEKTVCVFCETEEDFYSSVKENGEWQPRKELGSPVNTSYNEGAQCISPDGHYLFYTLCNTDFGYGSCDLYWAKRIGNRWSRPKNFDAPVCTKYWESQPAIAPDGKTIYLTFDDGPSANTVKILDILDKYNVKATFFVLYNETYSYLYKEIIKRGHSIALHSYSHEYSKIYRSTDAYFADLQKVSDFVYEKAGVRTRMIRFPGGSSNTVSRSYCKGIMTQLAKMTKEKGYVYFDWNSANDDATGKTLTVAELQKAANAYSGQSPLVMLMHDAPAKKRTVEALPGIIEHYIERGYYFLPLNEGSPTAHHYIAN